MTLIATLRCKQPDSIVVAADSGVSDHTSLRWREEKLDYFDVPLASGQKAPLVWGYSGAAEIGQDFARWLKNQAQNYAADWDTFKEHATRALAVLNGRKRERLSHARVPEQENHTATVLLAGHIDQALKVLEIGSDATPTLVDHSFYAIGTGALAARVSYEICRELRPEKEDEVLLRFVMARSISMTGGCDFPVRLLRVSADGVKELEWVQNNQDV